MMRDIFARGSIPLPWGNHVRILSFCLNSNPCSTHPEPVHVFVPWYSPILMARFLHLIRYVEAQNFCLSVLWNVQNPYWCVPWTDRYCLWFSDVYFRPWRLLVAIQCLLYFRNVCWWCYKNLNIIRVGYNGCFDATTPNLYASKVVLKCKGFRHIGNSCLLMGHPWRTEFRFGIGLHLCLFIYIDAAALPYMFRILCWKRSLKPCCLNNAYKYEWEILTKASLKSMISTHKGITVTST